MQTYMVSRPNNVITKEDVLLEDICQERCVHPEHALAVRRKSLPSGKAADIAALFAVLSDPTRLQIVYALLHATTGELCVCDLAAGLGRDDTTISHQLRVLRYQKVVTTRKAGRVVYYRLTDEHIRSLLQVGITHVSEHDTQNALEVLHA
jgi:DNA-binding transcriptional ArsR family regulator